MSLRPGWLRRRPLDWTRAGRDEPASPPGPVDVVLPVYGAFELLERCLASLGRHTDLQRHGLLLSLDGPGQEQAERLARRLLPAGAGWQALQAPQRGGFVAAANRGLRASRRDVVLLNSDTEVTPGWLEKLQAAACSSPAVASATPFCNDATLCSLPRPFVANRLPRGLDVDGFARLVESASQREYPRLPTGVGVCLYLRRRALDLVGLLDEGAFGLGYGEENDWCWRALQAGFVHVLDDATFVFHAGGGSFGPARAALQRRAARALARRHPDYLATIAAFTRADPLAEARSRVLARVEAPRPAHRAPQRVLHVVHGWPPEAHGGTEAWAHALAQAQAAWREVSVHARLSEPRRPDGEAVEWQDGPVRVRWLTNDFRQRDPWARNALANRAVTRDVLRLVDETRPGLVHVHHLAGHAASLMPALRRRGLPLVVQLQDWWPACARTNLVDRGGQPCPGPALTRCSRCFDLTRLPPAALANRLLHALRRRAMRRALACADAFVAGSRCVVEDLRGAGLLPVVPVHVLDYGAGLPLPRGRAPRAPSRPLRFGFVGALMPHKGPQVAVEAWRGLDPARATLELWGADGGALEFAAALRAQAGPGVSFRGSFAEGSKADVFAGMDVLLVPSLGRESFGLVCREAASAGVPVLASRHSALQDRLAEGCGQGFTAGDATELRRWVERLLDEPGLLDEWRSRLPTAPPAARVAEGIEEVYASVLERRAISSS